MLIDFFFTLRAAKLKVSVKEYLTLLEAIEAGVIDDGEEGPTIDRFYYLARTSLVKDEAQFDKFDRAFAAYFKGVELLTDFSQDIPLEWLQKKLELELTAEEKAKIEKMGWDELMETLKKRFEEGEVLLHRDLELGGAQGEEEVDQHGAGTQGREPARSIAGRAAASPRRGRLRLRASAACDRQRRLNIGDSAPCVAPAAPYLPTVPNFSVLPQRSAGRGLPTGGLPW